MTDPSREYVLVTEYFHPDTASTGQYMTELAVGLSDRGLDMSVLTGQPNYHSGDNEKQPRRSTHRGVPVTRVGAPQVRQTSLPRRLFNWTSFTIWVVVGLLVSRPDGERELLFVSNPPFLPPALWLVATLRGWEYTHVVYDVYPDAAVEAGYVERDGLVDRAWSWVDRRVYADARHVVALGPVMRATIADYGGPSLSEDDVAIIHNWADPAFITPRPAAENAFAREHGLVDGFTVLYSGNIGDNHDLETVVRAATAFEDDPVTFVVIGEGDRKDDVVELAERLGLRGETVRFFPYQPRERLPETLTCGDVSLVSVSEGMRGVCVSSKLYTSMAAGAPTLLISHPADDEARIVRAADAGIQVRQGDVGALVDAVETWRSDPDLVDRQGANARSTFERHFTAEASLDRYYALLSHDVPAPAGTVLEEPRASEAR